MVDRLKARFAAAMAGHAGGSAVAVSGGGDSLALMHLLRLHAGAVKRPPPVVLTVDHGLRAGSAQEARQVALWARRAGLEAHVLTWRNGKPRSGIEAAARAARYRLMGAWLARQGIGQGVATLFVGHTQDDQAETFLLRLARGSGLDGLAAMPARAPWPEPGFPQLTVARPLLDFTRAELRAFLEDIGQPWLDDPMNEDEAFDRVRVRKAQGALAGAGLTPARIAAAAAHLTRARQALETVTGAVLERAVRMDGPAALLDPAALAAAPREVGLRALATVLMRVSGQAYRPRFDALERLFDRLAAEGPLHATLHGCRIAPARAGSPVPLLRVWPEGPRKAPGRPRGKPLGKAGGKAAGSGRPARA